MTSVDAGEVSEVKVELGGMDVGSGLREEEEVLEGISSEV